ncbi:MAG: hypothetical protein NUV59_03095 [Patescibacteria group bacterium]|nr:hypothetical protein [Patescibacteria group bacterium]
MPDEESGVQKRPVRRKLRLADKLLASQSSANMLIIVLIALSGAAFAGVGAYATRPVVNVHADASQVAAVSYFSEGTVKASFGCAYGKSISALYAKESVTLSLSDGRTLTLPKTSDTTTDGTHYANPNDGFEFVDSGNSAYIEEQGARTYADCVAR